MDGRSDCSARSRISTSSSVRSQALASAAAAQEKAAYEEIIAKRTEELRNIEAKNKLELAQKEYEQMKQHAAGETELRILRARQEAAVETARSDAILKEERQFHEFKTRPEQTSNDHAANFSGRSSDQEVQLNFNCRTQISPDNSRVPLGASFVNPLHSDEVLSVFNHCDVQHNTSRSPISSHLQAATETFVHPESSLRNPFHTYEVQPSSTNQELFNSRASPSNPFLTNKVVRSSNQNKVQFELDGTQPLWASSPPFAPLTSSPNNPFYMEKTAPDIALKDAKEKNFIDLTKQISDTLALQRQPAHEPDVYDGDPLMFQPWRSSFETMINQAIIPATQKLAFLAKYTKGDVKALVDRFRHRHVSNPDEAYKEAWVELEKRFGNKSKIAAGILSKLTTFPKFPDGDRKKVQEFADLCVDTAAQMRDLPSLNILNYPHGVFPILDKLPTYLHNAWRKKAAEIKQLNEVYPSFDKFAKFIKDRASRLNDPDLYPDEQESPKTYLSRKPVKVMATTYESPPYCAFHERAGHDISECITFSRKPFDERKEFCKKKGLCFKCGLNHIARNCQTNNSCKKCSSDGHASFMHVDLQLNSIPKPKGSTEIETLLDQSSTNTSVEVNTNCTRDISCSMARSCSKVVLAKVYHKDKPTVWMNCYVVLDDQSNTCLGDPKLFNMLGIHGPKYEYELSTCGGNKVLMNGRRASGLVLESQTGHKEHLPVIIENENIPGDRNEIPTPTIASQFKHLRDIAHQIPEIKEDIDIILLLGRNCPEPLKVRECRNGPKGAPWAQRTTLGWTISGQICKSGAGGKVYASVNRTVVEPTCLYQSDGICTNHIYIKDRPHITTTKTDIYIETKDDDKIAMSMEDERFIQKMQLGAHTNANGNLEFPLPFKEDDVNLPNNRSQTQYRLKNLLKTLNKKPEAMEEYKQFMSKILSRNHASPVPESDINPLPGKAWYLPHFPVHHPKKNSLRVVFDGSAEFNGCSLNKALLRGPEHMNSLLGVLLRFRIGNIAVMGDIEQMFHNFYVDTPDRNFLRFLWFKDNDTSQPIIEYRMNVHLFGSTSSPAVATFGLRMIADNCKDTHGEDVAEFIHQDFYVDDGITSKPDVESTISLIKRSCAALMTKRLRFHKIVCNSIDVLKALPEEDINKDLKSVELHKDDLPTQRTLGVHWDLESDTLTFHVSLPNKPFSRRGVLSVSSSIFDPLGLVAPVTVEGKIMLRELMKNTKHGNKTSQNCWDSPLPERYLSKWIGWKDSLYELQNIQLPRCYQPPNFGPIRRREIHVFSDASDVAIGAVAYLRQINKDGEPHVAFLKGKSKLTPKHAVSIPRLELCAAVLATNIVENIKAEIENRMPVDSIMYYTDSKVVLGYISNESKRFHVYVANRVHRIHSVSDRAQWCHIDTDHNPADMASRSTRADRLMDTTWFTGPDFLWETKLITTNRQLTSTVKEIDEGDPEVRKQIKILKTDAQAHTHFQNRFCHFSRWLVLRRAIAILITRARHLKLKTNGTLHNNRADTSILTINKLKAADIIIFKAVQETFTDEQIKSPNGPLCKLNPFKDENGILRVGGRLRRSDLDLGGRHPILLPKDNHVSRLIAEYFHEQVQHQGRLLTAAALRSGGIWIIGAHNLVRSIINKCNICKRLRGQPVTQQMADLPKDRLESVPPFTNVGIDVFGPWQVVTRKTRGGAAESKRWAVLFTCLSSRAVHIEVINSMDTSSFIMSLRRFTAIRGPVARIRCDQGTNFVGARGEFQTILNDQNVTKFLVSQNCEWIFNPPHASHFGGVWERQIGIIRRILDTMFQKLGKHQLTDEVLRTFMAEACAVVNSHPITTLSTDPNDPLALNPTMLLTQKTSPLQTPPGKFVKEDLYGRKRWRHVQYLADQFWIRWRKEYLQNLQYRQKWLQPKPNISAGDVVILKQKDVPRYNWPLARVKKTLPSEDGRVRKVEVLVCSEGTRRTFLRPVSELILIEKTSEN